MKTLIKILCLSVLSVLSGDIITYFEDDKQISIKDVEFEKCTDDYAERTIFYKNSPEKKLKSNIKTTKISGYLLLISGLLNLYLISSDIDDIDKIKVISQLSNSSLALSGLSLITLEDINTIQAVKIFGENRKILTLLDDKGNLIDYECNQKENLQKNFLLEEN